MIHKPITIKNISFSLPHKTCFEEFSAQIPYGSRIALIGQNGSGKSTFLNLLRGVLELTEGEISIPEDVTFGYVPQVIEDFDTFSGGQRLNKALTQALSLKPNVLLLDEPTNHLDRHNRKSLMRMLAHFPGTLIIVSHDVELLRHSIHTLWHIDQGKIHAFSGNYDDYRREVDIKRAGVEKELLTLNRQKKEMHQALMQEQHRASQSQAKGRKLIEQRKWPTVQSPTKFGRASSSFGQKKAAIGQKKQDLTDQLSALRLPEVIVPTFSLRSATLGDRPLLSVREGSVGYGGHPPLLTDLIFSIHSKDRIAILGENGTGKTTLIKAILNDPSVVKTGDWFLPKSLEIGYLDQHYGTLPYDLSVFESIAALVPSWSHTEIRRHLNDFLFRKNEEINALIHQLSGGEKARLSLAHIAAKTPHLLILDELSNNLDLETREHVINVLKAYPGALLVISHDEDFLREIHISEAYEIENACLRTKDCGLILLPHNDENNEGVSP